MTSLKSRDARASNNLLTRLFMHIGVLAGGGDALGINAYIKTIVTISAERGDRVTGIRRG